MEDNQNQPQENQDPAANSNTPEAAPKKGTKRKEVKEIEEALASFPMLPEGYLTKDGKIFFDKDAALKFADEDDLEVIKSKHYKAK